ncbi:MAG TPA: hypothetical protein VK889_11255 [Solirubrobacterales bacterium]|nr:hypothetical protein [Solirubrobacterales bacterium]
MESVRDAWTDERLDDLARRMDAGFDRVDRDIREVRTEIREVRTEVRDVRVELRDMHSEMTTRFDSLHRMILQGGISLLVLILASTLANNL